MNSRVSHTRGAGTAVSIASLSARLAPAFAPIRALTATLTLVAAFALASAPQVFAAPPAPAESTPGASPAPARSTPAAPAAATDSSDAAPSKPLFPQALPQRPTPAPAGSPGAASSAIGSGATGGPGAAGTGAPGTGDAAEDIRDIRGPKFILPVWLVPALLAGALLLALGVYAAWRWLRRRRRPRALLPFEVALQRLEALRTLMQPQNAREFSIAVSDIVRGYIEQRFDVTATHQTTEEFLHDLLASANNALARHRTLLSEFLQQCDLVKFAGMSLTVQNMESLHRSACAFVLETAKPEPPQSRDLAATTAPSTPSPPIAAGGA